MDTEAKLKQIMDVLDQIAEDTSVPRNIRRGASEAKARLAKKNEALDLRVTSAIMIIDDLANDPNIPLHGRTLIWNVIWQLETVQQIFSRRHRFLLVPALESTLLLLVIPFGALALTGLAAFRLSSDLTSRVPRLVPSR